MIRKLAEADENGKTFLFSYCVLLKIYFAKQIFFLNLASFPLDKILWKESVGLKVAWEYILKLIFKIKGIREF